MKIEKIKKYIIKKIKEKKTKSALEKCLKDIVFCLSYNCEENE